MKYFKDPVSNAVHAYEADGSQDAFILEHLVPITDVEAMALAEQNKPVLSPEQVKTRRRAMFSREADPLFFKAQRGEATMQDWLAKVEEIRNRAI